MASIDPRPLNVKLGTTAGILVVPAPLALCVVAAVERTNAAGTHSTPFALLFAFCFVTGILAALAMTIAAAANKQFDIQRPAFSEYLKGLVMAPVIVVANLTVVVLTAFFIAAAFGAFFVLARHV